MRRWKDFRGIERGEIHDQNILCGKANLFSIKTNKNKERLPKNFIQVFMFNNPLSTSKMNGK